MTVARYPFSLTVHLKNGSQLLLDHAIHLNGEWEMCITQLCIPESQSTLFRDCRDSKMWVLAQTTTFTTFGHASAVDEN